MIKYYILTAVDDDTCYLMSCNFEYLDDVQKLNKLGRMNYSAYEISYKIFKCLSDIMIYNNKSIEATKQLEKRIKEFK